MSTETATADIKPFLFDVSFDEGPIPAKEAKVEPEETAETEAEEEFEEEIVPTFSEEELEAAKKLAFEEGQQQGRDAAMADIQRETRDVIKALSLHVTDLFAAQEKANNVLLRDGIGISTAMVRKMFPEMNRQNALSEVGRLIETTLMRLIEEPRIIVRTHPDMQPSLDGILTDLKAGSGYEGRILLKEDAKLQFGDCRIEWGDGSAERICDQLWQSIDQIVEENLGGGEQQDKNIDNGVDVATGVTRAETAETAAVGAQADNQVATDDPAQPDQQ